MANNYDAVNDAVRIVRIDPSTGGNAATDAQAGNGAGDTGVGGTAAAGAALTVTLPAVVGKNHFITFLQIVAYAAAATTGVATPVVVTTTNMPGGDAYTFPTALAIGTVAEQKYEAGRPIKSAVANTATTIVCPATTGVIWRVNVDYYVA